MLFVCLFVSLVCRCVTLAVAPSSMLPLCRRSSSSLLMLPFYRGCYFIASASAILYSGVLIDAVTLCLGKALPDSQHTGYLFDTFASWCWSVLVLAQAA